MAETVRDDLAQLRLIKTQSADARALQNGDGNGTSGSMSDERVAKLEGALDGLKQSQIVMIGAVTLVSALLLGSTLYLVSRVDVLSGQVSDLPAKMSAELRDINRTLSEAITASKQTPPQVILMPAPEAPRPAQEHTIVPVNPEPNK